MFVLSTISDVIPLPPDQFPPNKPAYQAIEDNIHAKYSNKVLQNTGLCICLWDVESASEGLIRGGDSSVYVKVTFRMVVLRPFRGEVLQGKVIDINENGIRLSIDFFQDIWVPKENYFAGATYLPSTDQPNGSISERCWLWTADTDTDEYYLELDDHVRFRVDGEVWHDHSPQKPLLDEEGKLLEQAGDGERAVPYTIIGSMSGHGLGPMFWWNYEGGEEGDAEGGAEPIIEDQ